MIEQFRINEIADELRAGGNEGFDWGKNLIEAHIGLTDDQLEALIPLLNRVFCAGMHYESDNHYCDD